MKIRQTFLLCLLSLLVNPVSGKGIDSVRTLLRQKSYSALQSYLDRVVSGSKNISVHHELSRQIVGDYSEMWIRYEESVPDKEPNVSTIHPFNMFLLLHDDSIIYCRMENNLYVNLPKTELDFSDHHAIQGLKNSYYDVYMTSIDVADLFNNSIVYGSHCGWGGTDPPYRIQLDRLVRNKDIKTLDEWLCSPVAEIQVYAIDGFHQLHKSGYKLNITQLRLISLIKKKKGMINTCSGCMHWSQTISEETKTFVF
jgi:hypothetical protein